MIIKKPNQNKTHTAPIQQLYCLYTFFFTQMSLKPLTEARPDLKGITIVLRCHSVGYTDVTEAPRPSVQQPRHTPSPTSTSRSDHHTSGYQAACSFKLLGGNTTLTRS